MEMAPGNLGNANSDGLYATAIDAFGLQVFVFALSLSLAVSPRSTT